jgi:CTP synthase
MDKIVLHKMGLSGEKKLDLKQWKAFLKNMQKAKKAVTIGLIGKYVELPDAYKSIFESLLQAATYHHRKLNLKFIHSEKLTDENADEYLHYLDGILIAPGFGQRGIEGKFAAIKYARENNKPTLGICLGMHCMVIDYARNVLGISQANSTEIDPNAADKVIDLMEEQKNQTIMGGSMRLGAYDCRLEKDSIAYKAYQSELICERHRHRYELNNEYKALLEENGMKCTGINPASGLVEVVEVPGLKWYVGVQYHPEYNSTVVMPNPLLMSFICVIIKSDSLMESIMNIKLLKTM